MEKELTLSCGFRKLRVKALVGVWEHELDQAQDLDISLKLHYAPEKAAILMEIDDLAQAHDYARAADLIRAACQERHHGLLEHLAGRLVSLLRREYPACVGLDILVEKPGALSDAQGSFAELSWRL